MEKQTKVIRIESILGGHSPSTHMSSRDQFRASIAIDPSLAADNSDSNVFSGVASGLLRPQGSNVTSTTTASVMWFVDNPKEATGSSSYYAYDANGSVYSVSGSGNLTALSDGGSMTGGAGNGAAYYDNYVYFAKNTTIARYGPLDGTPAFNGDYWVSTLGKSALNNSDYGGSPWAPNDYPTHPMHRHSDGKLYIADVVGGQGAIHYIQTTKTTVEGDTDAGSKYSALTLGYGLVPVAIETYGSGLAIAINENTGSVGSITNFGARSKIAFWDTTSQNINQIFWVEYPDTCITAMRNVGGQLYIFSGSTDDFGFRIMRYVGGYSFEEVAMSEMGFSPYPGAVLGRAQNLIFGSANTIPAYSDTVPDAASACVWSLSLHKNGLSSGLFAIARPGFVDSTYYATSVTALQFESGANFNQVGLHAATDVGVDRIFQSTLEAAPVWWSQTYRIGRPFKITQIRIPTLPSSSSFTKQITPTIYFDNGQTSYSLPVMNYSSTQRNYVFRPNSATGQNDFFLELVWSGKMTLGVAGGTWTVSLPIEIEYEILYD